MDSSGGGIRQMSTHHYTATVMPYTERAACHKLSWHDVPVEGSIDQVIAQIQQARAELASVVEWLWSVKAGD